MLTAPRTVSGPQHAAPTATGWPPYRHDAGRRWPLLLAAWAVLAVGLWLCREVIVDDAYITYRYSTNLANGLGPTWNPGESPVEGYTNFAWMLWHVPWVWLGVPLPLISHLTGAACAAATVWILVREPATLTGAVTATAAYLAFLPTYIHVLSGLETAAVALVILRAVVLAARILRDGRAPAPWELPALLLLAGVLRPDGVLAVAPALLIWLAARHRDWTVWAWTAAAAALGAGYMAWRWSYFGHPLPNTFYVKAGLEAVLSGKWLQVTLALLLPLVALAAALLLRRPAPLGALVLATTAAMWVIPALTAPAMDYMSRFAWHAVPVLCLAAAWALDRADSRRTAALLGAITVGWLAIAGLQHADARSMVNYGNDLEAIHGAIGRGLAEAEVPADARTLATSDAGAIPYYSGWRSLDYIGLNDEAIAHGADPTEQVLAADPTVIIVTSRNRSGPFAPESSWNTNITRVTAGYVQVAAGRMREDYWQIVFVRPEWAEQVRVPVQVELDRAAAGNDGRIDTSFRRWLLRAT